MAQASPDAAAPGMGLGAVMSEPILLNTAQACQALGGWDEAQLKKLAGEFAIKIGNGNYYKPADLMTVRDRLDYGRQS